MSGENFFGFENKVVLITGASSGIGATTAKHFAKHGAVVSLTGRNLTNLKKAGEECEKCCKSGQRKPLLIQGDVTKTEDLERIISETISTFGRLDVLVNNAGIFEIGPFETSDLDQFDRIMNTNLRAVFQLTKLAMPHLIKTKGNIINVSSMAGIRSFDQFVVYSTCKAALNQFTKCISLELAPKGVRVNGIAPGVIVTEILNTTGFTSDQVNHFIELQSQTHPIKRVGQPDECADLILFLAGNKAGFITGEIVVIDGGYQNIVPNFFVN